MVILFIIPIVPQGTRYLKQYPYTNHPRATEEAKLLNEAAELRKKLKILEQRLK